MVSPIPWWPIEWKLVVSALTAILLYVYVRGGTLNPDTSPSTHTTAVLGVEVEFSGVSAGLQRSS
jgi:hypothetical protein